MVFEDDGDTEPTSASGSGHLGLASLVKANLEKLITEEGNTAASVCRYGIYGCNLIGVLLFELKTLRTGDLHVACSGLAELSPRNEICCPLAQQFGIMMIISTPSNFTASRRKMRAKNPTLRCKFETQRTSFKYPQDSGRHQVCQKLPTGSKYNCRCTVL